MLALAALCSCHSGASNSSGSSGATGAAVAAPGQLTPAQIAAEGAKAPPASQTGGFDGAKAYAQVAKLVSFGPRPPASDAIHRTQQYIESQLQSFGCAVDEDNFNASTPIGNLAMKNIIAKVPGTGRGIILLLTHYDTLRLDDFVGAEDGGSSTGLMLEMARVLCGAGPQPEAVWIAFLDGEEAQLIQNGQAQWTDTDSVFGARELAARMAISGDLDHVDAVILADMVGQYDLKIKRDTDSAPRLVGWVWDVAAHLGYSDVFVADQTTVDDDHRPFVQRGIPAVDIIDFDGYKYWHTTDDTLDKISAKSLATVGYVILESINAMQAANAKN